MPGVKGLSGRRRTPTAALVRRGDPRGARRMKTEPEALPGLPPRPVTLSVIGSEFWRMYEDMLVQNKTLSRTDGLVLHLLSETFRQWNEADAFVRKYGEDYLSDAGEVKQYPAVKRLEDSRKDLIRLLRECGLSPSSRTCVAKLKDEPKFWLKKIT